MPKRKIEPSVLRILFLLLLTIYVIEAAPQQRYELLLKGGHVIDPLNGIDALKDVAISQGKIAAVADAIPVSQADKVVNVSGLYVVPGLIDLHTHLYATTGMPALGPETAASCQTDSASGPASRPWWMQEARAGAILKTFGCGHRSRYHARLRPAQYRWHGDAH